MGVNHQQSTNTKKDDVVQLLDISKQRNLSDKEASRLINDIISSSKDDTVELHRSKRGLGKKSKPRGNLGSLGKEAAKEYIKDLVEEFIDYFSSSSEEQFTDKEQQVTEEQSRDFVEKMLDRGVLEEVWDRGFVKEILEKVSVASNPFRVLNKLSEALNELFKTSEQQVTDGYSNTSLHLAAEQGNLNAVKYFVEKGGDISAQDEMGYTPLHLAAKQGNLDIIKYLVEKGADVDVYQGGWGYSTPLHLAAANGHLDTVKYLMGKGANPNAIDGDGKTPLQRANEKGISDIVEYLAERVQQVTEVPQVTERQLTTEKQQVMNEDGDTALHLAAVQDDLNAVKHLIEQGANVDVKNKYGGTPLHIASIRGNLEIAQFLLDHGADVNAQVVNGLTPLNWATLRNHLEMVKLLLDRCADVNIKEGESDAAHDFGYGRTPLISAVVACNTEIAKLLLDNGADVSIKGRGLTALDFASTNKDKCPEMLALLKDGNIKSSDSRSHCTSTMAASNAARASSFISGLLNWVKNVLPQNTIALFHSQQSKSSYDISSSSWVSNNVVDWIKGSTESLSLLASGEHNNHAATALPEINTTVVNNTIILGILTAGLFYKTKYKQPIHENLLSPREQSMRLNNIDENMIIRVIQQGEEKFGDPDTKMDEVKISGNKTGMWKRK
ncbi:ankyrin repeat domain-containing protein [Wolbachia endosymbiont (group A) of Pogonocherus hispidulus]|uniref:ankyrin repeat domain-containing protein n=1 Tax=Wolbachia endosymbiont (group A) of Pogonocherus hispidulus TaxID=3066136 RepID=UPI0033403B07